MRFPGGYRKEKGAYQSLLYFSDYRYTYDEMLEGFRAYYHYWGVEIPEVIPDDWWDVMTTILKDKSKDPDFRLRKLLNLGYEGWRLYQESQRIIKMQKKAEYESRRSAVSTLQGESIVDLVRKQCENLDSDPFELMEVDGEDHNWSPPLDATVNHARGACLWHDSTSGNSAWIDGRDGWTYHCSHCTNDKPLDAFDYWRLSVETKELGVDGKVWYTQHRNVSGYEWVKKAKQWLSIYEVEVPQLTPDVQTIKDAIADIKTIPGPPKLDLEKISNSGLPWNEQVEEACRILMKQDSASLRVQYTNEIRQHFSPITEAQIRQICTDVNTFHREVPTHVGDIIFDEVSKLQDKRSNPGISGYRTGLGAIDTITNGFSSKDLVVVAGPSSTGKTLLAKQMALSIASKYKSNDHFKFIPHVFNSAESSTSELIIRLLCQEAYIPITKLINGEYDDVEWMRVLSSAQRIAESNLFIDGTPEISTSQMRQKLIRLKDEYGCIGSIWVDHFNKLAKPYPNDDRASYSQIADELKSIQTEFNCPMIVLSQLTSSHEGRADHRPNEYDLLFGKTLKNNLDKLLMLYNPEKWEKNPEDAGLMHVYVPKNRDGQTGMVKLEHDFAHMTFKDLPGTQVIKPIVVMPEPEEEELVEVDEYGVEVF
jgi:replicative DNA helicase